MHQVIFVENGKKKYFEYFLHNIISKKHYLNTIYRCDMYLHVVESKTQTIAPVPQVLKVIDAKYDFLKDYYAGFAIENVVVNIY